MFIEDFKVEEWFNKYEKNAVYDLADTCIEPLTLNELFDITGTKEEFLIKICAQKLNYGAIHGSERLQNGIVSLYKNQSCENITITHGAIGANQLVMLSLIEPGDRVISVIPTYQQHYSIPKSFGAEVYKLFLKEKNYWLPDLDELENAVQKNTKLICINNPNNPTGSTIPEDMLYKIANIAQKAGAYILCDEVYRGLNHQGNNFGSSIADIYDRGISTGSMSKVFSLAGLRLGWIAANTKIIKEINKQREYNTISIGILDDYFASIALEYRDKIAARNLKRLQCGKNILTTWLKKEPRVHCVLPQAGTTTFVRYDLPMKSEELCAKLQNETGVMILPGSAMELDGYLRIGYGNNFKQLKKGLEQFSDWMTNYSRQL